jgi:hypothetical protein
MKRYFENELLNELAKRIRELEALLRQTEGK